MIDLLWYYHRLRAMNSAEILHRLRSLAWMMCRRNAAPSFVRVQPPKPWDLSRPPFSAPAEIEIGGSQSVLI